MATAQKADHFGFRSKTNNLNNLLSYQFTGLDSDNEKIEFIDNKTKVKVLNFKIE